MSDAVSTVSPALAIAIGVGLAIVRASYLLLRPFATAIHEAGHALLALLSGRRLQSIHIHRDSSGETVSVGRPRGFGAFVTLLGGYPAPSVVGWSGCWSVTHGYSDWWVWGLFVLVVGSLLLIRNLYGAVVILALVVMTGAALRWADPEVARSLVLALSSFFVIAGLRADVELISSRRQDDATMLAKVTQVPASLWKLVFALIGISCLAGSGWAVFQWLVSRSGG